MDRPLATLVIALLFAPGYARAQEAEQHLGDGSPRAPFVSSIEFRLPPGEDAVEAAKLVALAPGDRLTARALRRTVQRLYQTGRYRQITVKERLGEAPKNLSVPPPAGSAFVDLIVEAEAVRRVVSVAVTFLGKAPIDAERIRAVSRLRIGEPFEDADLHAAGKAISAELSRHGWRDAQVSEQATPSGSVTLSVDPGPETRIGAVRFTGDAGPAFAEAGAALRSRVGQVVDEDVLNDDVRSLRTALRSAGYGRARVDSPIVKVESGKADVEIRIEAGPLVQFNFLGNAQADAGVLRRQLAVESGDQPLDALALEAAVERLEAWYHARGYAEARIEVEERSGGPHALALVFHVEEGPAYRVRQVNFDGVPAVEGIVLRSRLAAYLDEDVPEKVGPEADRARARQLSVPGSAPDAAPPDALKPSRAWEGEAWDRAIEKMVDFDRAEGFVEAVYLGSAAQLDWPGRTIDVTIRFRQGPLYSVESISFEGNRDLALSELARLSRLAPGDPLQSDRVENTRTAILRQYLATGHLYATVETKETRDRKRHVAALRFVVTEGPKVRVGRVVLNGNVRTKAYVVRGALELSEGSLYTPEAAARSQAALLRLGVFRSVDLRLQEPEVPGEVKDLAVELNERPYATLSQGIGYSLANGPRATVEYSRPNLFGRALELSALLKVNYPFDTPWTIPGIYASNSVADRIEGRADLGLSSQQLGLPFQAGGHTDLVAEVLHRRAYDLSRAAGIVGLDVAKASRASFSLQYELEVDNIRKTSEVGFLTQADVERLRFDEGITTLQAVRPTVTLDFRDNSTHPHRGFFLSGYAEWAHSLGDGGRVLLILPGSDVHSNFVKLEATGSTYLPLWGSVLALSVRSGRVLPLDPNSETIIPRRFFMGGSTTMRGFGEEAMIPEDVRENLASEARHCAVSPTGVGCTQNGGLIANGSQPISEGGEAFLLAKGELRLPLSDAFELGFFVDFGNLWLDPTRYSALSLRTNLGAGLRFLTPIGPAALDIGFNLTPDALVNEQRFAPHFTVGLF